MRKEVVYELKERNEKNSEDFRKKFNDAIRNRPNISMEKSVSSNYFSISFRMKCPRKRDKLINFYFIYNFWMIEYLFKANIECLCAFP